MFVFFQETRKRPFDLKKKYFLEFFILVTQIPAIQQKVHKVGKQNFAREAFKENEVKIIEIGFLQKMVGRDI